MENRKLKLAFIFSFFAVLLAAAQLDNTITGTGNVTYNIGTETLQPNYTNLYPASRSFDTVYWNNASQTIILSLSARNMTANLNPINISISINGTEMQRSKIGAAVANNFAQFLYFEIPSFSNYNLSNDATSAGANYFWYEWNKTFQSTTINTTTNNYSTYNNYSNTSVTYSNNASNLTGSINVSVLPFDTCTTPSPVQWSYWNGTRLLCYNYADDDSAYLTIANYNLNTPGYVTNSTMDRNLSNYSNIPNFVSNSTMDKNYNNLSNIPADYPNATVNNNLVNWNYSTGYTIFFVAAVLSPVDSQRYYFGNMAVAPQTTSMWTNVTVPKSGIIKWANIHWWGSTVAGSNENVIMNLSINNSVNYTIATVGTAVAKKDFVNNTLNINVVQGNNLEFWWNSPVWATNPTGVLVSGNIYIE